MTALCPSTGKACHPSWHAAARIRQRLRAKPTHRQRLNIYRCRACGTYHLGREQ